MEFKETELRACSGEWLDRVRSPEGRYPNAIRKSKTKSVIKYFGLHLIV